MSLAMSNTVVARVAQATKSLLPKSVPIQLLRSFSDKCEDTPTHTGQKWESDDYRLARFIHAPKQVNQNWAVNMIVTVPPKEVTQRVVWCDGGSGPEGHPRVYINLLKETVNKLHWDVIGLSQVQTEGEDTITLNSGNLFYFKGGQPAVPIWYQDKPGNHSCGYCGLRFVKKDEHH